MIQYSPEFIAAVDMVITLETASDKSGAYHVDPSDPGGATKWGIAQRYHPTINVRDLTRDDAMAIYFAKYWLPLRCSEMPFPVAIQLMDCAVNPGQAWAARAMQSSLGVAVDGDIGAKTMGALASADPRELASTLARIRLDYWQSRPGWERYSRGWSDRSLIVLAKALI